MVIYALIGALFLLLVCAACFACGYLYAGRQRTPPAAEKPVEKQPETDMEDELAKEQLRAAKQMADGLENLMAYTGKPQKKAGDRE